MTKTIYSNTKNENYFSYLLMEIIMVSILTFIAGGLFIFYILGRLDNNNSSNYLEYLFNNPGIYALLCLIPCCIAIAMLLYFRNRKYIIGFLFNEQKKILEITYRGLLKNSIAKIELPYPEIKVINFKDFKVIFNSQYKGKRIHCLKEDIYLDFIVNNFIWEEHPKEKHLFLASLNSIHQNLTESIAS